MYNASMNTPLEKNDIDFVWSTTSLRYATHSPNHLFTDSVISSIRHALSGNPKYQTLLYTGLNDPFHLQSWFMLFPKKGGHLRLLNAPSKLLSCIAKNVVLSASVFDKKQLKIGYRDHYPVPFLNWFHRLPIDRSYLKEHLPSDDTLMHFPTMILMYGSVINDIDIKYKNYYERSVMSFIEQFVTLIEYFNDRVRVQSVSDFENQYVLIEQYKDLLTNHCHILIPLVDRVLENSKDKAAVYRIFTDHFLPMFETHTSNATAIQLQILSNDWDKSICDSITLQNLEDWKNKQRPDLLSFVQNALAIHSNLALSNTFEQRCHTVIESYESNCCMESERSLELELQ